MIPWAKPNYWGNEKKYIMEAVESLWISGGHYIEKLEFEFSKILNSNVLTTSNGTTSIHLIYRALGLKPDDEIIVPGFCFLSAANISLHLNLKPVFVDVDKDTWCLDVNDLERKITNKTRVIVPVHTYGNICEMNDINDIAKKHNLIVLEDCAESLFSKYEGKYCGTLGDVSSFSFQSTKTITTGEGGMVVTNDKILYDKMFLIRSHGLPIRGSYLHTEPGHNFRLTNLQAAMGVAQLEQINKIKIERNRVYEQYKSHLINEEGITFQKINSNVDPLIWAISIFIDQKVFKKNRDEIINILKDRGIETRPGFVTSSYIKYFDKHHLDVSEKLSDNIISLPSFATLTNNEIYYISECLKNSKK